MPRTFGTGHNDANTKRKNLRPQLESGKSKLLFFSAVEISTSYRSSTLLWLSNSLTYRKAMSAVFVIFK